MGGLCLVVGGSLAREVSGGRTKTAPPAFLTFLKTSEPTTGSSRSGALPRTYCCTAVLLLWLGRWMVGGWWVHWVLVGDGWVVVALRG